MALTLRPVKESDYLFLYELLKEKTPEQNISHKQMPTWEQHIAFNRAKPYKYDYVINERQGRAYITHSNEVGIHIQKDFRGRGLAGEVLSYLQGRRKPLLANISPRNTHSIHVFEKAGFKLLRKEPSQWVYQWNP